MATCPCCSDPLLRHIRGHQTIWFCRRCWQPMPAFHQTQPESSLSLAMPLEAQIQRLILNQQRDFLSKTGSAP